MRMSKPDCACNTYRKVKGACTRVARKTRAEAPHRLQLIEKFSIRARCLKKKTLYIVKNNVQLINLIDNTSIMKYWSASIHKIYPLKKIKCCTMPWPKCGANCSNKWGVVFYHRREATLSLALQNPERRKYNIRALAPGHKQPVVFYFGHKPHTFLAWVPMWPQE